MLVESLIRSQLRDDPHTETSFAYFSAFSCNSSCRPLSFPYESRLTGGGGKVVADMLAAMLLYRR